MDWIGRKQTMTLGFGLWAIVGFIIGGALAPIQKIFPLFIVLYGIFNALGEMGPGVATFLCGAESFPTPVRGHFLVSYTSSKSIPRTTCADASYHISGTCCGFRKGWGGHWDSSLHAYPRLVCRYLPRHPSSLPVSLERLLSSSP